MNTGNPASEDDDRPRVMCISHHKTPLPGARAWLCSECSGKIWVSYSLMPRVRAEEMVPLCEGCALPLLKQTQAPIQLHPDTLEELGTIGLREYAETVTDTFNRHPELLDAYAAISRQMPPDAGADVHRQRTQSESARRRTHRRHMRRGLRRNGS